MNKKGFTLVEVMIVIIIVAILASITVMGYRRHVQKANATEGIAVLNAIKGFQEVIFFRDGSFMAVDETDRFNFEDDLGVTVVANPKVTSFKVETNSRTGDDATFTATVTMRDGSIAVMRGSANDPYEIELFDRSGNKF